MELLGYDSDSDSERKEPKATKPFKTELRVEAAPLVSVEKQGSLGMVVDSKTKKVSNRCFDGVLGRESCLFSTAIGESSAESPNPAAESTKVQPIARDD